MGNVALCAPAIISNGVVKVLLSDGRLVIYTRPVKATEIMLENPGQFVSDSCQLKIGHRIEGLSADEELEVGQVYYLLPMEMLYSILTSDEMSSVNDKASKALKKGSLNFSKIFPVFGDFCLFPLTSETKTFDCATNGPEIAERYSRQRSWKPALETIIEAPTPLYV